MSGKSYLILAITAALIMIVILIGSNLTTTGKAYYTIPRDKILSPEISCDGSGEGTRNNPYEIYNCFELQAMRHNLDANFEICTDIDCSMTISTTGDAREPGFIPVGTEENPFTGYLDGKGHTINQLNSLFPGKHCGLFGYAKDAEVKNLFLEAINIQSDCDQTGGLAGYAENSVFTLIHIQGEILNNKEESFSGGIFGNMKKSTITNSESLVSIEGKTVGGIAGSADKSRFFEVHTQATLKGETTGGIVGIMTNSEIDKSFSYSSVEGLAGGLASTAKNSIIKDSFVMGDITGEKVAGLVYSLVNSIIENSYFRGQFYSQEANGISAEINSESSILNSYFDKELTDIEEDENGKTSDEMKEKNTYQMWDFENIWGINEKAHDGFPYHI